MKSTLTRAIEVALWGATSLLLGACSPPLMHQGATYDAVQTTLDSALKKKTATAFDDSLLPPLQMEIPKSAHSLEPRFDLSVNAAPAAQVFMALVAGTRYSMVVAPEVSGTITVNLKNVTVREALESIRETYGYDFSVQGSRINVLANTLQTRLFQISYLAAKRGGGSATRVMSGSASNTSSGTSGSGTGGTGSGSGTSGSTGEAATVFTGQASDFWFDLAQAMVVILNCTYDVQRGTISTGSAGSPGAALMLQAMNQRLDKVQCPEGRNFVLNPQSGVVMVRALPPELREITRLLKALQTSIERQVMLEAKIVEVELKDDFQSGINWQALDKLGRPRWGMNTQTDNLGAFPPAVSTASTVTGSSTGILKNFNVAGALGLAFQTTNFASILQFLQTQGTVYVMSSPRIATLNNQKAVLKVGSDDYFITAVTPPSNNTSSTSGTTTTNPPTITTQPFFSGIALDVTPQIDEDGQITLHIRPSITEVSDKVKEIDFGTFGLYKLPYATSKVKEADSIVRVRDGMIVAIGGLMTRGQTDSDAQVPGAGGIPLLGNFFKQGNASKAKRELVILLKPTVIREDGDWQQDLADTQERLRDLDPRLWQRAVDPLSPR